MVAGGHFGWPKITFDRITRHFRSIRNFFFFKMAVGGHFGSPIWPILDDRKSLSIAFLAISDQYTTFIFLIFFSKWPPAAILEVRFAPKTIGFFHYVLSMPNMKLIGEFMTTVRDATSIFIQNGRQRPFCFSDWCQKSQGSCNLGPQWLWRIWIWLVYLWQSYGLYKRWQT